jgi:hypothetical protein
VRNYLRPPDGARARKGGSALLVTEGPRLLGRLRRAHPTLGLYRRLPARALTWLGYFAAIGTVLIVRNAYLFTTKIYPNADFAADTIYVLEAKRFELLTGDYSRLEFYHPGPAFLYVEAWGQWLFHDVAHVVPTPWNGQLLGILLLNAALLATSLSVITRDGRTASAVASLGTVLAFTVLHPLTVNSNWPPYYFFAPTLLLLVSAAAVAAGRTRAVPLLCLSAGLCIHGQAEFLFFAPIVVLVALTALFAPHWRQPRALLRVSPRHWLAGLAVTLALALPIVLNTVLHWPGQWPRYLVYATKATHLDNTLADGVGYMLRFWWPGGPVRGAHTPEHVVAAAGGILLLLVACWLARTCPHPDQRRFLLWSLAMVVLLTVLFTYYAWRDIDELFTPYEGYFYWTAPLLLLLTTVAGIAARIPAVSLRLMVPVLAAMTIAFGVAASLVPLPQDDPYGPGQYFGNPEVPHDVAVLAAASHARPIVLTIDPPTWTDVTAVIAYGDQNGVRICVDAATFRNPESICTPAEIRAGMDFAFRNPNHPLPGRPVLVMPVSLVYRLPSPAGS